MILFFLLLLLLPLTHAGFQDHRDCFLGKFRVLCGAEDYTGPLTTVVWDDNLFVLGGDKKIVTREHLVTKGNPITVRDGRDTSNCWFYDPYIIFTSLCKNPSSTAVDPDMLASFKSKFQTNEPLYTACRNMPSEKAAKSFKDVPETVIQLAEADVDCKNK